MNENNELQVENNETDIHAKANDSVNTASASSSSRAKPDLFSTTAQQIGVVVCGVIMVIILISSILMPRIGSTESVQIMDSNTGLCSYTEIWHIPDSYNKYGHFDEQVKAYKFDHPNAKPKSIGTCRAGY